MDKTLVDRFYCLAEFMKKFAFDNYHVGSVSKSEFSMLQFIELCKNEMGLVTTSVLSERLHISKPAVSQMINVLEQKKYVTREINKSDRRLMSISLTRLGNQVLEEEKGKFLERINVILDKMGREDSEAIIGLMEKYFENVKETLKE